LERLAVEFRAGDVRERESVAEACRGMDVVFHVAGVAGIWGPWEFFHGINTRGTEHVVAGCLAHRVGRLVYTSSPSVSFDGRSQRAARATRDYPRRWLCHYARSKALGEKHVLTANGVRGLKTCALRPHLIWGPRDRHLIPRLLERARAGRLLRVGDGTNRIDMVYVDNAARAHLLAADALVGESSPPAGRAYYISQGEPVNCWQWIDQILALADLPPVRRHMSLTTAWTFGALCEAVYRVGKIRREPPMTRFLAAQLGTSHYYDMSPALRDFGYIPQISTDEGMRRLARTLCQPRPGDSGSVGL
jgi:nucleoside-diphosphate-sugar epimerase